LNQWNAKENRGDITKGYGYLGYFFGTNAQLTKSSKYVLQHDKKIRNNEKSHHIIV